MSIDINVTEWVNMQPGVMELVRAAGFDDIDNYLGCTHKWLGLYSNGTRRVRFTFDDPDDELYYRLKWNNIC